MFTLLRRLVVIAVLVLPTFLGLAAASAGAATTPPTQLPTHVPIIKPNVKLVGHGSSVTFRPFELSVQDKTPTSCTPLHGEWTMSNTTKQTQAVLIEGHPAFMLKPSEVEHICTGPGQWVFAIVSSPEAKLMVSATLS